MNSQELDKRIEELTRHRERSKTSFLATSDKTRNIAGSIQDGMYWGQLAIGMFRKLTNYHYPPKKRVKQVLITISIILVANLIRKAVIKKEE